MAELLKKTITRKELDEGEIPANYVLCEVYYSNENLTTKSGILIGFNKDVDYCAGEKDTSSRPADMAEVSFKVVKLPERLYFNGEDQDKSMPWEVEYMELAEDDIVFTNIIEASNAITLECEGKQYRLLPYQDLYCVKREIWLDKWEGTKQTIVVMLNGYVLTEQMMLEAKSALDVTTAEKIDQTQGKISFIGLRNKQYLNTEYSDIESMEVGDIAIFDKKYRPHLLERSLFASKFSEDKLYWIIPRRRICAVIRDKQ